MAKNVKESKEYWMQVCLILSQVTFGVFWASIFLSIDVYKVFVIVLNGLITVVLLLAGWILRKSRL